MLKGNELNEALENELKEMVQEGIEKAPISKIYHRATLTIKLE